MGRVLVRVFNKKVFLSLFSLLILLFFLDFEASSSLNYPKVLGENSISTTEYPILRTKILPEISAKGAVVMDSDSKVVLYSKNPDLRFSTASTAKIMTALTALSYFKPNDILTVGEATDEGTLLGLKTGQQMTFRDILYGLLLPSANDVAFTIAQNYSSTTDFVRQMNLNAVKLNLYNTHYQDPAGLEDDGDYTTPLDLARLASVAIKNPTFAKVVGTKQKTIADLSGTSYQLNNLNKLLGFDGVDGVKTGTTEGAGQVLVTSKLEGNHTIIIVVMGSQDRFTDTEKLLSLVSDNITYLPIRP